MNTHSAFTLFKEFPELSVHICTQEEACESAQACAMLLGLNRIIDLNQVHGATTHVVHEPPTIPLDGDALITNKHDLGLSIKFADCQAFVVYAPAKQVLGVIHAGWRGMAEHMITAFFSVLHSEYKIAPKDTVLGAAPSLCSACAEFSDPLTELPKHLHPFVEGKHVDLVAAADAELATLGVQQIERLPGCTCCGKGLFSHRRGDTERNYLIAAMTT